VSDKFDVELRPHYGRKRTPQGPIPVHLGQSLVMLNGTQVAIVGDQADAPLITITRLDPRTAERLHSEVARLRGNTVGRVSQPPDDGEQDVRNDSDAPTDEDLLT